MTSLAMVAHLRFAALDSHLQPVQYVVVRSLVLLQNDVTLAVPNERYNVLPYNFVTATNSGQTAVHYYQRGPSMWP